MILIEQFFQTLAHALEKTFFVHAPLILARSVGQLIFDIFERNGDSLQIFT